MSMIKRSYDNESCANCKYAEQWDGDDDSITYRCRLDMRQDECDGQPDEHSDYEVYARENGRW